jgi:hypothetical protein
MPGLPGVLTFSYTHGRDLHVAAQRSVVSVLFVLATSSLLLRWVCFKVRAGIESSLPILLGYIAIEEPHLSAV